MALATEGATNSVEAVAFSFLTDKEILQSSRVKVTDAILVDNLGRPVPNGLYDPAFGPFVDRFPCKTCGLPKDHCSGHFGHIELVATVYNPLMFTILSNILKKTCFSCHHFKANRNEVDRCLSKLKLIMEGNISKAKSLDGIQLDGPLDSGDFDVDDENQCSRPEQPIQNWTSIQFSEAMSVLRTFLLKDYRKCQNCGKVSPKITKPIFGWFHVRGISAFQARGEVITGSDASSESETINDDIFLGNVDNESQILSTKLIKETSLSGSLLPSQVRGILKLLWKNEAKLCSYISDIQNQGFGKKAGHSMFFLENIFVAPIKFRPPLRTGDNVADHPQTVMLSKVLESNISLGQARHNKLDASFILRRWMDLQRSVNLLFDNKSASKSEGFIWYCLIYFGIVIWS